LWKSSSPQNGMRKKQREKERRERETVSRRRKKDWGGQLHWRVEYMVQTSGIVLSRGGGGGTKDREQVTQIEIERRQIEQIGIIGKKMRCIKMKRRIGKIEQEQIGSIGKMKEEGRRWRKREGNGVRRRRQN
jgi:hypothetical protein